MTPWLWGMCSTTGLQPLHWQTCEFKIHQFDSKLVSRETNKSLQSQWCQHERETLPMNQVWLVPLILWRPKCSEDSDFSHQSWPDDIRPISQKQPRPWKIEDWSDRERERERKSKSRMRQNEKLTFRVQSLIDSIVQFDDLKYQFRCSFYLLYHIKWQNTI